MKKRIFGAMNIQEKNARDENNGKRDHCKTSSQVLLKQTTCLAPGQWGSRIVVLCSK